MKWREELAAEIERLLPDRVFVLTDSNVSPLFRWDGTVIVVPAGEESKSLDTLAGVWEDLSSLGATRRSVLVNIGGGVVSDLGGFAAATFKRGIRFINIPTTLLAMSDAAIGGKTGIDFGGLKNEVGAFRMPERVIVDASWLATLPQAQMREGLAEVVKSALLGSEEVYGELLNLPETLTADNVGQAAEWSARFKEGVVARDPLEKGLRRILNLGHTAGHAFESLAARVGKPIGHGTAVAHGLLIALRLSERLTGLSPGVANEYEQKILNRFYPALPAECRDVRELIGIMAHDKKNPAVGEISFVLLRAVGEPVEAVRVDPVLIAEALKLSVLRR